MASTALATGIGTEAPTPSAPESAPPVPSATLTASSATLATGGYGSCTVTPTGAAYCWGKNAAGQLGNGDLTVLTSKEPLPVFGLTTGVTAIATAAEVSCAIESGAAKCWGGNLLGQLGNGTTISSAVPVQVSGLTSGVTAIATSTLAACAVVSGAAKCWGYNASGQLGNGSTLTSPVPSQVEGLTSGVTAIALDSNGSTACAIVSGAAQCWGANGFGQLGNGTNVTSAVPVQVSGLTSGVEAIDVGANNACAIQNGAVKCWGDNTRGVLGNGTLTNSRLPVQTSGLTSGATSISISPAHGCAIVNGVGRCWGSNTYGQLGNTGSSTTSPGTVIGLPANPTSITTGTVHTCANVGFNIYCWGSNANGEVGLAPPSTSIPQLLDFKPIAATYAGVDLLSTTSVRVRWLDNSYLESGFFVYRYDGSTSILVPGCSATTPNLTQCVDTGLLPGTYYQYYVYAWSNVGVADPGGYIFTRTPPDAPAAPYMVSAVAVGQNTITIDWIDNADNETGFRVYRYANGAYLLIGSVGANVTTATIQGFNVDTSVAQIFTVAAYTASETVYADTYIFSQPKIASSGPVAAPRPIGASATGTTATIKWTDNATDESGYLVYRVDGFISTLVSCPSGPNVTQCTDTGLTPGTYYQYFIYSWNASGVGSTGSSMVVHTPYPLPAPVLTDATAAGTTSIRLSWTDNATDESNYVVAEYNVNGSYTVVATLPANTKTATITGLLPGSQHVYTVYAVRGVDVSYAPSAIWMTTRT